MGFVEYQPHQIVFLACNDKLLYAEVIQTVSDRGLCWARPLAILIQRSDAPQPFVNSEQQSALLLDLRQGSDLLLPLSWFQIAVDTEVIPVLAQLSQTKPEPDPAFPEAESLSDRISVQDHLQQFVRALCQKNHQPQA